MALSMDMSGRRFLLAVGTLAVLATRPRLASADGPLSQGSEAGALTMAEIGVGTLLLPSAPDCLKNNAKCASTDGALLLSARPLVQIGGRFVFGVSATWGIGRASENADIASASGKISRTHQRDFFFLSPIVRYYPFVSLFSRLDAWVGLTGGAVIISDRYRNDRDGTSSVGPQSLTISTTGTTFGGGLGVDVRLTQAISLGGWTHGLLWLLPGERRCAQTYECATLGGTRASIEGGLTLSYRLRL